MECIETIQKAIAYMEENIFSDINYEDVARQVYMSNYHFHKIFSMITGITANEYIKRRRLSMAGQEISMSHAKVIDISLKYGYDSPESFSKAFTRFHGITPNVARRSGAQLKSFNPLVIKIKLEGGTIMDYKIVERKSFKVLAKVKQFSNEIISEENNRDIPDFWKECGEAGAFNVLAGMSENHDVYGLCGPISKESKDFNYGIGMEYEGSHIPEGFEIWEVKETLWAVFKAIGEDPQCIGDTWDRIYKEFLPTSEYTMLDDTDFELYPEENSGDSFCEIWIPVKRK